MADEDEERATPLWLFQRVNLVGFSLIGAALLYLFLGFSDIRTEQARLDERYKTLGQNVAPKVDASSGDLRELIGILKARQAGQVQP